VLAQWEVDVITYHVNLLDLFVNLVVAIWQITWPEFTKQILLQCV